MVFTNGEYRVAPLELTINKRTKMRLLFWRKTEAEKAVARGVRLLNNRITNWRDFVDPDILDLGSPYTCVLGQLNRAGALGIQGVPFYGRSPYGSGAVALFGTQVDRNQTVKHGFDAGPWMPGRYDQDELTEAWKKVLR
jgi:hypothetical protein